VFKSAVWRLTGWYLLIIVAISLFFSSFTYFSSPREVRLGLPTDNASPSFTGIPMGPADFDTYRQQATNNIRHRELDDLLEFNLIILLLGGGASYWLAQRTLRPIEDSLEAQGRFTADASHELRTPLTVMRSEIEVALRDGKLSKAEAVELLKSNLEEVGKLEELSAGLLKLAQHDGSEPLLEEVSLQAAMMAAAARQEKLAKTHKVAVDVKVADNILVEGQAEALTELFSVLLNNAIKYSHPGGTVWVEAKPSSASVQVAVRDEGIGIKAVDLPHVFSRFYRADSSRSKLQVSGYGLGLSIAQKIVTTLGGTIQASSTPGKGSSFTVSLRRAQI